MGNAKSVQEIEIECRVREKLLNREYKRCLTDEAKEVECVKQALTKGNKDLAKIHAENVLRKKREAIQILELLSQIDNMRTECKLKQYSQTSASNSFSINVHGMGENSYITKLSNRKTKASENITDTEVNDIMSKIALESDIDLEKFLKLTNVIQ
ncbi:charged multivesicular body protein 1 [Babesia microti strain RI]|uniref:Charged multivesicular body protein 1 n=1 Tax=Babesia microti (strain RI) TaxID=1133968 RepID=A0A1R4AA67_BABMR|nr:charged multivesicular body protein 1 [Babesia microti strain RI]SJK85891.1 charged multivesicular body protein 1 [Babesia microti strain RI]|eukprot:XP_021338102.1 charged multivesicular body protein 1 [Babesia microti strain RI]